MEKNERHYNVVVGLGEVGVPLMKILERAYPTVGRDLSPVEVPGKIDVLHICYPYEIEDFVGTTVEYIREYSPSLVIVHSTVVPGTTRAIYERTGGLVAYSPVRGKHTRMVQELLKYTKFVAGTTPQAAKQAARHLEGAGLNIGQMSSPDALELSKLMETTYFGLLIAWAQEVERYCQEVGVDYDELMKFTEEVTYLPPVVFQPGYIGGHCILPNTYLLERIRSSPFIKVVRDSNDLKKQQWLAEGRDLEKRLAPKSIKP